MSIIYQSEVTADAMADIIQAIASASRVPGHVIEIKAAGRSSKQNRLLHLVLGHLSKSTKFNGSEYDIDGWKTIIISAYRAATGQPARIIEGLEGEPVMIIDRSSRMSRDELNGLIDAAFAYAAILGVRIPLPPDLAEYYESIRGR